MRPLPMTGPVGCNLAAHPCYREMLCSGPAPGGGRICWVVPRDTWGPSILRLAWLWDVPTMLFLTSRLSAGGDTCGQVLLLKQAKCHFIFPSPRLRGEGKRLVGV